MQVSQWWLLCRISPKMSPEYSLRCQGDSNLVSRLRIVPLIHSVTRVVYNIITKISVVR
jgi:hypothetical protein